MIYYKYKENTLEYLERIEAKEGREPAFAVGTPPPKFDSEKEKCVLDMAKKSWLIVSKEDFTKLQIALGNKEALKPEQRINELGEVVSKEKIDLIKEGIFPKEKVIQEKLYTVSRLAGQKIESGFESKAKGQYYIYDSKLEDQFNIQSLMLSNKDVLLRCTKKSDGVKDFYPHTAAQLKQIVEEFSIFKTLILKKSHEYKLAIGETESAVEIEKIEVNF